MMNQHPIYEVCDDYSQLSYMYLQTPSGPSFGVRNGGVSARQELTVLVNPCSQYRLWKLLISGNLTDLLVKAERTYK